MTLKMYIASIMSNYMTLTETCIDHEFRACLFWFSGSIMISWVFIMASSSVYFWDNQNERKLNRILVNTTQFCSPFVSATAWISAFFWPIFKTPNIILLALLNILLLRCGYIALWGIRHISTVTISLHASVKEMYSTTQLRVPKNAHDILSLSVTLILRREIKWGF